VNFYFVGFGEVPVEKSQKSADHGVQKINYYPGYEHKTQKIHRHFNF
jgi:hypothetical protein